MMISFFVENFSASIFMKISVSRLHPPYADITNGVKEPYSISITRWLYFRFFSFSLRCVEASGLKILTSKMLVHLSSRNFLHVCLNELRRLYLHFGDLIVLLLTESMVVRKNSRLLRLYPSLLRGCEFSQFEEPFIDASSLARFNSFGILARNSSSLCLCMASRWFVILLRILFCSFKFMRLYISWCITFCDKAAE